MGESLTQRRRVGDEGPRVVNPFRQGRSRKVTVPAEEAPANYVPAAAVRSRGRALSGFIVRKARVGGSLSRVYRLGAEPRACTRYLLTLGRHGTAGFPVARSNAPR